MNSLYNSNIEAIEQYTGIAHKTGITQFRYTPVVPGELFLHQHGTEQ